MFYQPNNYHNNSLLHPADEMYFHPEPFHSNSRDTPRELSFIVLKDNSGKVDFAKKCSNDLQADNDIQINEQAQQQQCDPLPTCDSFVMETPKKTAQRNSNYNHENTSKDFGQRNLDALLVSCVKRKGQYNNHNRNSDYSQQETSSQKLSQSSSSRLSHQGIREVAEFRLEELKKDGMMQESDNDRGLNQMFGMVAREIQNSFWQMNEENELQQQKRSKSSASLMSSSSGGSEYNVWENSELEMRGIDTSNWIDLKHDQPTPFTLFHLYKARAGQIDGVPISNQQVLRIMDRFVQNKKAQNIHQYPWFCFDDRLGYAHLQTDIAKEPLCMQFIEKYQEEQKVLEKQKLLKKQHKKEIISQQSYGSAGTIAPPPSSQGFVIDPKLNRKQVLSATRITPDAPTHFQQSARKDKNSLPCFKSSSLQRLHTNQTNQTEPFDFDDLLAVTYASDEKHILTGRHFRQDPKEQQERCNQKEDTKQLSLSPPIKVIDENPPRNHSTVRLKAKIIGNVQCKGYNSILKNQPNQRQIPQQIISPERNLKKMTTHNMDKTPVLKRKNPKQISDMTSTLQKAKSKIQNPSLMRQPSLEMKNNCQSNNILHGNDKTSKKGSSMDKSTSILKLKSKSKSKEPKKFTSPSKCMSVGIEKKKTKQEHTINFNNSTANQTLSVKQVKTTNNSITPSNNPSHQQLHKHPCVVQSSQIISGQTCQRKDFLKYFSADYEAELKKRRFVSSSCDRVPKLHHVIQASPDSNRKKISLTPQRQIQSTVVKKNCPGSVQKLNQFSSCPNNLKTTAGRDTLQTIRSKGPLKSSRCLFQWQEPQIVTSEFTVGEHKKEDIFRQDQDENHECNETFDPALVANNIDFSQFYSGQGMAGKVNRLGQISQKDNINKILDPKEIEHKEAIQREQEKNKLSEVLKQLNDYQCDFQRMCQLKGITESISSARQFRQQEFGLKNEFVVTAAGSSKINENSRQAEEKIFKNRLGFFKALKNKQISQKPYLIV